MTIRMTKVGLLSDIHGNGPALDAVLSEFEEHNVETILCLGDLVGVHRHNSSVVDSMKQMADYCLFGNHDMRVFPTIDFDPNVDLFEKELEFVTKQLNQDQLNWLETLSLSVQFDNVYASHVNPFEFEWGISSGVFPRSFLEVASAAPDPPEGHSVVICAMGHTHEQHAVDARKFGHDVVVVNPGTVGETGGNTAEAAIVETETGDVELLSVTYTPDPDSTKWFAENYTETHGSGGHSPDYLPVREYSSFTPADFE